MEEPNKVWEEAEQCRQKEGQILDSAGSAFYTPFPTFSAILGQWLNLYKPNILYRLKEA